MKPRRAPRGTITAVYLNSEPFHGKLLRYTRKLLMAAWTASNEPTRGVFFGFFLTWQAKEWGSACGMSEHKEEFMMWRNEAGRNHWEHLTRKSRACFCQRGERMTNVWDCCSGQSFHLQQVTLISLRPCPHVPGTVCSARENLGVTFAETMRPHYAHNLTSVNSLAQKVWMRAHAAVVRG